MSPTQAPMGVFDSIASFYTRCAGRVRSRDDPLVATATGTTDRVSIVLTTRGETPDRTERLQQRPCTVALRANLPRSTNASLRALTPSNFDVVDVTSIRCRHSVVICEWRSSVFLALKDLRVARGRFVLVGVVIGLVALLTTVL